MKPRYVTGRRLALRVAVLTVLALGATPRFASAQAPTLPAAPAAPVTVTVPSRTVPAVAELAAGAPSGGVQAGCTSCGSLPVAARHTDRECTGGVTSTARLRATSVDAARKGAAKPVASRVGRGASRATASTASPNCSARSTTRICCPDPCYEPRWVDAANASLFTPSARPATYTRFRWDHGNNLTQPDRAEYFWAAIGGKGPANPEGRVNYNELSMYVEMGGDRFSFYINTPYRNQRGDANGGSGGFGDLTLGTKTMFLDSELLQMTFQLGTTIPVGLSGRGIGNGHVSMEPSLLWAVKLFPETYWQGQLGYWIPISGTSGFAGSVVIWNNSLNHVLCRPMRDTALIGTIESTGYTFTAGSVTNANGVVESANDTTYFNVGPGLRLAVCDKLDIGFGVQFAVTGTRFAQQLYRTEFRWRF